MEDVDPLPLYTREPQTHGNRLFPLCPHRNIELDGLRALPRRPGTYGGADCEEAACARPQIILSASNNQKLLFNSIPIANAVYDGCPREAVRKYFNKQRITEALSLAQLRICPHLTMNSKLVSSFFRPSRTLHTDHRGRFPQDPKFARCCCQKQGPRMQRSRCCPMCTAQGFYTAFSFISRECPATSQIPHEHVEIHLATYSNIGTLDREDDIHWVAHTHDETELQEWHEIWTAWREVTSRAIFWRPLAEFKACPVEMAKAKKKAEEKAAKCDEASQWRRQMYGTERLDLQPPANSVVDEQLHARQFR